MLTCKKKSFPQRKRDRALQRPDGARVERCQRWLVDGCAGADRDAVVAALKNVYDPELGLNIVDLGLVYEIDVDPQGGVDIQYSLTTMGCPIGPMIEDQMRSFLKGVPGVGEVRPSSCCGRRGLPR